MTTSYAPIIACGIRFSWNTKKDFYENAPAGPAAPVPYVVLSSATDPQGNVKWFASSYITGGSGATQELAVADFLTNLTEHYLSAIKVLEDLAR